MRIHDKLPIFHLEGPAGTAILYTPGALAAVTPEQAETLRRAWGGDQEALKDPAAAEPSRWLLNSAVRAAAGRAKWLAEEFKPECLTVYLSNRCGLNCVYCFSRSSANGSGSVIDPKAFAAAAALTAESCAEKELPFQLCLHGGGDPALHWDLLRELVRVSREAARSRRIPWRGYIATSGALELSRARELGALFGEIGLSCDGPDSIHDRQRPASGGGPTSHWVRQTARAAKEGGARLAVRVTVTSGGVFRLKETADYCLTELKADSLVFEPVYGEAQNAFAGRRGPEPEEWASLLRQAANEAAKLGVPLSFSGLRPEEFHGPCCNVLRHTLHLAPDGFVTNCFLVFDKKHKDFGLQTIGRYDSKAGRVALDWGKIASLKERAAALDSKCRDCFASFHCARSCPDRCALPPARPEAPDSFRCRLNREYGRIILNEAALELVKSEGAPRTPRGPTGRDRVTAALAGLPSAAADAALESFKASRDYDVESRSLPAPLWEAKGFDFDGEEAWERLCGLPGAGSRRPFSIYAHIPFCPGRCGFCDCYAFKTAPGHSLHERYTNRLAKDIRHWSELAAVSQRPVTTVHFGGGTPGHLGPSLFATAVRAIRAAFSTRPGTEWAVEATAGELSAPRLEELWSLGFRRLHIGVQTLEEPLRQNIGRRLSSGAVLERIAGCLRRGFVTTADLLYGLPGETARGFFKGLELLEGLGVHGLSLYRFNHSFRNRSFRIRHLRKPDAAKDFALFAAADAMLLEAGFEKNHFCHYAKSQDKNLYFTHARRGEDLLALGASADGVFGDLIYRCGLLSKKFTDMTIDHPLLQGGAQEIYNDTLTKSLSRQLITGSVPGEFFAGGKLRGLLNKWTFNKLIKYNSRKDEFALTGSGSWHISSMLAELSDTDRGFARNSGSGQL
jgi:radical SAM protein with 4Fe4S-binding SPASM domain